MSHQRNIINVKGKTLQQIIIDPLYGCLYLQFSEEKVAKTIEHNVWVNLDLDVKGHLVGIEFVGVKKFKKDLKSCFIELSKIYNRPELRKIPSELKRDLAFV
jgi:uncharacterized protein YuzE